MTLTNPFVRTADTTAEVMTDVIIALLPCVVMAGMAFGSAALGLIAVSVGSALAAEFLFTLLFGDHRPSLGDGSAVVTGLLLAFTIGAFTPLYVVAAGAAGAVIFGKLLWGGLGRNLFNPALVGRELMTVFFPVAMASGSNWYNYKAVYFASLSPTGKAWLDSLFFHPGGAVGEYSVVMLVFGGLYLLVRRRITWHIPVALFTVFTLGALLVGAARGEALGFSLGGVILGAVFMATDMPTSATTPGAKLFYGALIGLSAVLLIALGDKFTYMSFSILIVNGFAPLIDRALRPRVWGAPSQAGRQALCALGLLAGVVAVTWVVSWLVSVGGLTYVVLAFVLFCIGRYIALDLRPWMQGA